MSRKNWSIEEDAYLEDTWGSTSIPAIAKHLGRTVGSVKNRAVRKGLGRFIHSGEYITFLQLIRAIGKCQSFGWLTTKLEKEGFPIKLKTMINKKVRIVYIEDFWKWTEKNQNKIDFSDFEENMLGPEPKWAKIKRVRDRDNKKKYITTPWTEKEDKLLEEELNKYKHSYLELSVKLRRSEGAIQRRICDLGIKARPIKADNHKKWTKEEYEKLGEMIKERYTYGDMSGIIGKSEKAIRGRVYDMYLTENLDKVVDLIGNGKWGDGRPELKISHKKLNTEEKKCVKSDMSKFIGILNRRMMELYDTNDYWQSKICQNWSNSCLVNIENCDECNNFRRIQPQYCRRCGVTVMSRDKIDMCQKCRQARKKQYQRKYMALKGTSES